MRTFRLALAAVVVGIGLWSMGTAVHGQAPDGLVGTWTLDAARSKFSPGPAPKSLILTIAEAAGGVTNTSDVVMPDGQARHTEFTVKVDGKDYPVTGVPGVDTVALSSQGETRMRVDKKAGKVVMSYSGVLAADGKTFTVQQKGTDPAGQALSATIVFVKKM